MVRLIALFLLVAVLLLAIPYILFETHDQGWLTLSAVAAVLGVLAFIPFGRSHGR